MKKFITCILIIAIFSAFVFYLGWTQFKIKPGQVGIVVSKTDGVLPDPVENGKSSWNWQFLLPTNAKLITFTIEPYSGEKTVKGQLPSGQTYTAIFNNSDNFEYFFRFSISLTLTPENLLSLYKNNKITKQEDLQNYLSNAADTIAQLAARYYLEKLQANPSFVIESVRREDLLRSIRLYEDCPEVDLMTFALKESKVPDYALYKNLQNKYFTNQTEIEQVEE